jgi:plasmid replication initiation protein
MCDKPLALHRCGMKKSNGEMVAVMANQIARARHALKVQEQRLFLWLVGQVDPFEDKEFEPVRLSVADYAALFGRGDHGSMYQQMKDVTTGLLTKLIEIYFPEENRRRHFQWLSQADYLQHEGVILVELHKSLKPYLIALKKEFARIPLLEALQLRSRYSIAFYQMCCSWYGSQSRSWTLQVEELREWLRIEEGELVKVSHLKSRVIDQARRELDEKSRISFKAEAFKIGRKITGWKFTVIDNNPKRRRPKGAVSLPESAQIEERQRFIQRQDETRALWMNASQEQKDQWLAALPAHVISFAPAPGAEPRTIFLSALRALVEPELALS